LPDDKIKTITGDQFSSKKKKLIVILVVLIVLSSLCIFFFQQSITEENIKKSIFNKFKDSQMESTRIIAESISSDLQVIMSIINGVADLTYLQSGESYDGRFKKIINEKFTRINNITKVNGIYIINNQNVVTYEVLSDKNKTLVNKDLSNREYIKSTKDKLEPIFSNGFNGLDNVYNIALTVPITNKDNGKYVGTIAVEMPTESFFEHYGNINDINTQFLVVYDKKGNLLAVGADKSLLGENFFNEKVQNFTNHNSILMNSTSNLLQGSSGNAIYNYGRGERLTTTFPVFIESIPEYFIQIVTPTLSLYSEINNVLFGEKLKILSLLIGTIAAVASLIIFLIKWNIILNNVVKARTRELEESNKLLLEYNQDLAKANEELKIHDKMQREFINIASHEIKTPVQSILSFSQLLSIYPERQADFIESLQRNANRLKRLSSDILDVTKIESKSLKIKKEVFDLNVILSKVVDEYEILIQNYVEHEIKLLFKPSNEKLLVDADKERISEVISNLISNAIKFTEKGEIVIDIDRKDTGFVFVSVKDTGKGIDPEISEKLFSKFTTTSFQGIGLGLYISKNIIEAHGGKIWAENNKEGNGGAIFYFSLPFNDKRVK
jgi:signal transduction histidine kinase